MIQAPILTLPQIAHAVRRQNKPVALIGGTFDVFHIGHIRFLEKARKYGVVVVGVTADTLVRVRKGGDRPYMHEQERAALISRLRCVDYVFIARKADWLDAGYIGLLKPDVFIIGREPDTIKRNALMRALLKQHAPSVRFIEIKRFIGRSTTDLATQIRQDRKSSHRSAFHVGDK